MKPDSTVHRFLTALAPRPAALLAAGLLALAGTVAAAADSGAPAYAPQPVPLPKGAGYLLADGSIQVVSNDSMADIVGRWNELFARTHPEFKFKLIKANNIASANMLAFDKTAFSPLSTSALGTAATPYAFFTKADPFSLRVAHGSANPAARLSPLVVIVNKHNPLDKLSVSQLSRIYNSGGRKLDISHWGQLGVKGALAQGEIHPCGLPESTHYPSEDLDFVEFLQRRLGSDQPPLNYRRLGTYAEVSKAVSEDPAAMGIVALNRVSGDVKIVGLAEGWGAPTHGTEAELLAGRYPFDRFLYVFVRRLGGQPVEPFVAEYLRMVLSREGQDIVAAAGYLPLSAADITAELQKLQ